MQCEEIPTYCVVKKTDNILGWEVIGNYAEKDDAIEYIATFFNKSILYQ